MATVRQLEHASEWLPEDIADPRHWTETLSDADLLELEAALEFALGKSNNILDINHEDFPLPSLSNRLHRINEQLVNGRGFAVIRGIDKNRYTNDQMCLLFWGIGIYIGQPVPQNKHGHMIGDVTDQGKSLGDPTARANEIGTTRLGYHSDATDVTGLMCMSTAASGGTSLIANVVAIHNYLVERFPNIAAELYRDQPMDFRGEQPTGMPGWYPMPVFAEWNDRLFVRYVRDYVLESQRHPDAPRLTEAAVRGLDLIAALAQSGNFSMSVDLEPGDLQFVNNHHLIHDRTAYVDEPAVGRVRLLKRLWLEDPLLPGRPDRFHFSENRAHWAQSRTISRLDADE